jgi:hypothetical protein
MSTDYFFLFFIIFLGSALFLWLLGAPFCARPNGLRSLYHAPWIGFGLLVGGLQIAQLVSPIDRRFSIIFFIGAFLLMLAVILIRLFSRGVRTTPTRSGIIWLFFLGVVALIIFIPVFNSCTKEMYRYDLGLYYLKTIRWIQTFPIVPGLANVQDHLGFNQSAFLPTSLFDSLVPNRWGLLLVGGFLPWLGLTLSVFALLRLAVDAVHREHGIDTIEAAYAVSLPAWIFTFLTSDSSSASPDCMSACLMLHLFLVFAGFVLQRNEEGRATFGEIILLGAVCLCVKLNSLGLVIGIWLACGAILWQRKNRSLFFERSVLVMAALAIIILGTWIGRGIVLSGYPFFPSSAAAMPVEWRTPIARVDGFRTLIQGWARDREHLQSSLRGWHWVSNWYNRVAPELTNRFTWPAHTGFVGLVVLAAFAIFARSLRKNLRDFLLLTAPLVLFGTFWFLSAPEPRYFGTTVWIFAMCPALTFIAGGSRVGFFSGLANLCVSILPIFFSAWEFRWSWARAEPRLPEVRVVPTIPVASLHGVVVWVPTEGDRTFDSPLPSSQGPVPELALLNPVKGIVGGFKHVSIENYGNLK